MSSQTKATNSGKPYVAGQLVEILSMAPTKANCEHFAQKFGRSVPAIMNIYRWAATRDKTIKNGKHANTKFVLEIKNTAKLVGWVSF